LPKVSNGLRDYYARLAAGQPLLGGIPAGQRQAEALLDGHWRNKTDIDQFSFASMMWAGALLQPGHPSIKIFLKKLFGVIFLSGVISNTNRTEGQHTWEDAEPNNLPVASFLSHGGRLIIQLPVRTAYDDTGQAFFDWLTQDVSEAGLLIYRSAATHQLAHRAPSIRLFGERRLRLEENRGMWVGAAEFLKGAYRNKLFGGNNHFGVNVALGGAGNINPVSGNTIAADGAHGHLYIYFNAKDLGRCSGIMIGCENSAPGSTSQTFVFHGPNAKSEKYSPCGTNKWENLNGGPKPKAEAMVVDLSDGWSLLPRVAENFTENELDWTPSPTMAVMRGDDEQRAVIYAISDMLAMPTLEADRKTALEAHLKALLTTQGLTKPRLTEILTECGHILRFRQPTVNGAGSLTNPMPGPVQREVQGAMTACRNGWGLAAD